MANALIRNQSPRDRASHEMARTGSFFHLPGWKAEKKFPRHTEAPDRRRGKPLSRSAERSFFVILASGMEYSGGEGKNGIAILDNDNHAIVLDQHFSDPDAGPVPGRAQKEEFDRIMAMDWFEFSRFCRSHPRLRLYTASDIMQLDSKPHLGNRLAQLELGLAPNPNGDIRTPAMKAIDRDPSLPYRLDPVSRDAAICFLAGHRNFRCRDGAFRMAWWIGPRELLSNAIPEAALPRFRDRLTAPYLRGLSHVPCVETGDRSRKGIATEMSADFEMSQNGDTLLLTHIDDRDMAWDYPRQLLERLERMGDDTLGRIWLLAKVLDQDLRPTRQIELARTMPDGRGFPVADTASADMTP